MIVIKVYKISFKKVYYIKLYIRFNYKLKAAYYTIFVYLVILLMYKVNKHY